MSMYTILTTTNTGIPVCGSYINVTVSNIYKCVYFITWHTYVNMYINHPELWTWIIWTLLTEATNTNFIVFGLTRPGLEPTIYRTLCDHANHYATDAVIHQDQIMWILSCIILKQGNQKFKNFSKSDDCCDILWD
jgi:hypothetical protein